MTISYGVSTLQNVNTGNSDLVRFIRGQIEKQGPQSFAWFMRQALYHPAHGYYSSGRCVIGRKGDYFTNVSVGPLFGKLLGAQFSEIWKRLGNTNDFVIVEQGAHDGQFALDVLEFVQKRLPEFFDALRYRILEPFPILEQQQRRKLEAFGDKVTWLRSLEPFSGVHFSNELLDAMPVRLISNGTEKLVGLDGDKFVFVERPQETTAQPSSDNGAFNEAALECIDQIAANMQRGYVIAIDYGFLEEEFERSIQVRAQHRNLGSPLEQIGAADITMSVDWRSIMERARTNGLRVAGFTDQHHFLTGIISEFASGDRTQSVLADSSKAKRQMQTLLHPEMLGRAFQVLALEKNFARETNALAGFKFAAESRSSPRVTDSVG
jgi:SAM-dependent MidA family methyltransferase